MLLTMDVRNLEIGNQTRGFPIRRLDSDIHIPGFGMQVVHSNQGLGCPNFDLDVQVGHFGVHVTNFDVQI